MSLPPYVATSADQRRWSLCEAIVETCIADPGTPLQWQAVRSLFHSDIPTDSLPRPLAPTDAAGVR
jgi:hypothetical protein